MGRGQIIVSLSGRGPESIKQKPSVRRFTSTRFNLSYSQHGGETAHPCLRETVCCLAVSVVIYKTVRLWRDSKLNILMSKLWITQYCDMACGSLVASFQSGFALWLGLYCRNLWLDCCWAVQALPSRGLIPRQGIHYDVVCVLQEFSCLATKCHVAERYTFTVV